jgi:predicted transcriptional regulator of viral defense system
VVKQRSAKTAADQVYAAVKTFKTGADLADIQAKTGFGEKKLRNLIYRLHKLGRIQRQSRGVYRVNPDR